jgi:hypothetical protein
MNTEDKSIGREAFSDMNDMLGWLDYMAGMSIQEADSGDHPAHTAGNYRKNAARYRAIAAALTHATAQAPADGEQIAIPANIFPRHPTGEGGWVLDGDFVDGVIESAKFIWADENGSYSLEEAEAILLVAETRFRELYVTNPSRLEKCRGCNGHGMVGNILDSDTCPFCKGTGTDDSEIASQDPTIYTFVEGSGMKPYQPQQFEGPAMSLADRLRYIHADNGDTDFNADLLEAADLLDAESKAPQGWDAEFLSKRLKRVAGMCGVQIPDNFTHEQVVEFSPAVLGQIAAVLEKRTKLSRDVRAALEAAKDICSATGNMEVVGQIHDALDSLAASTPNTESDGGAMLVPRKVTAEICHALSQLEDNPGYQTSWDELLEAAALSLPAVSQWQPIETAPKDGTPILILYKGHAIEALWECVDSGDWESGQQPVYWWSSELNYLEDGDEPTHWMPLPTPPIADKGKE